MRNKGVRTYAAKCGNLEEAEERARGEERIVRFGCTEAVAAWAEAQQWPCSALVKYSV